MGKGFQIGDVIGFSGRGNTSAIINLATYGVPGWGLSHVAMVGEYRGRLVLFEATTLCDLPCWITGKIIDGVQAHPIKQRVQDYHGRVWHYPLYRRLFAHEQARISRFLISKLGTPYTEIGAIRAGGLGWSTLESYLAPLNMSAVFCSELCAAAHATAGLFQTGHVAKWSPNRFARRERWEGILRQPIRLK